MNDTQVNYLLVGPVIKKGFLTAHRYFWHFLLVIFIYAVVFLLSVSVENIIIDILCFLFMLYFSTTVSNALLKLNRGGDLKISNFFIWPKNGFKAIFISIISVLIICLPILLLFLIITPFSSIISNPKDPSFISVIFLAWVFVFSYLILGYLSVCLMFSKIISLEEGLNPIKSIKKSFKGVRKNKINILAMTLTLVMLTEFFVILTLGIGILWAIPTIMVSVSYAYTQIFPLNVASLENKNEIEVQSLEINN